MKNRAFHSFHTLLLCLNRYPSLSVASLVVKIAMAHLTFTVSSTCIFGNNISGALKQKGRWSEIFCYNEYFIPLKSPPLLAEGNCCQSRLKALWGRKAILQTINGIFLQYCYVISKDHTSGCIWSDIHVTHLPFVTLSRLKKNNKLSNCKKKKKTVNGSQWRRSVSVRPNLNKIWVPSDRCLIGDVKLHLFLFNSFSIVHVITHDDNGHLPRVLLEPDKRPDCPLFSTKSVFKAFFKIALFHSFVRQCDRNMRSWVFLAVGRLKLVLSFPG